MGDGSLSDERIRRMQLEEKLAPKRECPVPKPGGLIGQVLGMKKESEQEELKVTIQSRVEQARREARSGDDQ